MELLAERDPEEARQLLDPVLDRMMAAVHQYEGTVNQVMGDGIMALFGAPLAHEDHAVRALVETGMLVGARVPIGWRNPSPACRCRRRCRQRWQRASTGCRRRRNTRSRPPWRFATISPCLCL